MKSVVYSERVKEEPTLQSFAQRATEVLDEVLGPSAGLVDAAWDRIHDTKGRTLVSLRVSDWSGSAETRFAPWETGQIVRLRLYHLWGDLLQARSHMEA
jgi:hypothetical protein